MGFNQKVSACWQALKNSRFVRNVVNPIGKYVANPIADIMLMMGEGASAVAVFNQIVEFATGQETQTEAITPASWTAFGVMALSALPLAFTVRYYSSHHSHSHQHDHDHDNQHTDHDSTNSTEQTHSHHHHGCQRCCPCLPEPMRSKVVHALTEAAEFLVIGVPFGLLTGAGVHYFLKRLLPGNKAAHISLAALFGLRTAWGNFQLHHTHAHAEEGYRTLLKKLHPTHKKVKAVLFSLAVFSGHFFQGFLDGNTFLDSFYVNNIIARCVFSSVIALLVTGFEGNTEMRQTLLFELEDEDFKAASKASKALVGPAAFIHSLLPTIGIINFSNFICNNTTALPLYRFIPYIALRSTIMAGLWLTMGYPNAKGYFCAVVPATSDALHRLQQSVKNRHRLFICSRRKAPETLPLVRDDTEAISQTPGATP